MSESKSFRSIGDRRPEDYAIEFGEYLAKAAERLQDTMQSVLKGDYDEDELTDRWRALDSAIYEFRKRAGRVQLRRDPREEHIRALASLMLPTGRLSPEAEEYLRHHEYGLALEDLAYEVMCPIGDDTNDWKELDCYD